MEQLTESKTPRSEPESITRLRQITATRVNVNVDTVEAWLHALAKEPWRGPGDVGANPPVTPARAKAIERAYNAKLAELAKTHAGELTTAQRRQARAEAEAAQPELIKVSEAQLLADLADLGHFVFVTSDDVADVDAVWADKYDPSRHVGDDPGGEKQLPLTGMAHLDGIVLVDPKYSRKFCGRDLLNAVKRAVSFASNEEEYDAVLHPSAVAALRKRRSKEKRQLLQRWVLRRYWGLRAPLTYPVVATVAMIASLGRIEELDEVAHIGGEPNPHTASLLVEAWDFLTVGVDDSVRAVQRICADAHDVADLDSAELDRAVLRLRTLHEGIATRLERELRSARAAQEPNRWRAAAEEFARRVAGDPARWNPEIGELNSAQILRLVGTAGIPTEEPSHHIEADVRGWISEEGLGAELATPLLWHGVSLTAAGHGEAFRAALKRRAAGDLHWATELNAISVTAEPAAA